MKYMFFISLVILQTAFAQEPQVDSLPSSSHNTYSPRADELIFSGPSTPDGVYKSWRNGKWVSINTKVEKKKEDLSAALTASQPLFTKIYLISSFFRIEGLKENLLKNDDFHLNMHLYTDLWNDKRYFYKDENLIYTGTMPQIKNDQALPILKIDEDNSNVLFLPLHSLGPTRNHFLYAEWLKFVGLN